MSFSMGGQGGLTNEPNMTPMIDVLLVLLIIFMLVVPMSRKAIDLQLPDPNPTTQPANPNADQIVLEVLADGNYEINNQPVARNDLDRRLREVFDPRPDKIIFVKGDPTVKYQAVIEAIDKARGAGVIVIGVSPKDPS